MMVIFATSRQSRRLEKGFEGEEELGAGRGRATTITTSTTTIATTTATTVATTTTA